MTIATASTVPSRQLGLGFVYWLSFLLVLEPGNLAHMVHVDWTAEVTRILGAATIGAVATPFAFALVHRFPVDGDQRLRAALIEALGAFALSGVLIFLSCVLADWFLPTEHRPFLTALPQELSGNGPLLVFCIVGILAIAHAMRSQRASSDDKPIAIAAPAYATSIAVKERGQVTFVPVTDIDWIESQGNYAALHVGPAVHLVRQTLASLEADLDPERFTRIHRRTLVARDRIGAIESLGAGDSLIRLHSGTNLRLSRSFRASVQPKRQPQS
jgi:hypothetical protein